MESWLQATIPAVPQGICLAPREKLQGFLKPQGLGERKQLSTRFCVQSQRQSLSIT